VTTTTPPNCTECGEPCVTGCIKRCDAADEQHDFHVDCYITMLWWLGGHHDNPSENDPEWVEYRRKMRAILRREVASQKAAT
jgi:hypothetical protein